MQRIGHLHYRNLLLYRVSRTLGKEQKTLGGKPHSVNIQSSKPVLPSVFPWTQGKGIVPSVFMDTREKLTLGKDYLTGDGKTAEFIYRVFRLVVDTRYTFCVHSVKLIMWPVSSLSTC